MNVKVDKPNLELVCTCNWNVVAREVSGPYDRSEIMKRWTVGKERGMSLHLIEEFWICLVKDS